MIQAHPITTEPTGSGQSTGASCNSPARPRQSRSVPIRTASVPIWPTVPQQRPAVHPAVAQPAEPVPNQLSTSEPISTTGTVCGSEPVWPKPVWTKPIFFPEPIWSKSVWSKPIWSKPVWSKPEAKRGHRGLFGGRVGRDAGVRAHWEEEEEKGDDDARAGIGLTNSNIGTTAIQKTIQG